MRGKAGDDGVLELLLAVWAGEAREPGGGDQRAPRSGFVGVLVGPAHVEGLLGFEAGPGGDVLEHAGLRVVGLRRRVGGGTEPKRLAELGYLSARKEPGKTRERTVYTLTDKGLDALRAYAETAVTFTPVKSDPLLRLMICDLVGEDVTRRSMATLRDDLADIRERLADAEQSARRLPHREKNLLIVIRFLHRLLDLHDDLVDEVQRELAATAADGSSQPAEEARATAGTPRGAAP